MIIKFYGTRGSIPVCEPQFQEFGGNTFCIAFYAPKRKAMGIMDAGSGIRNLGKDILSGKYPLPEELLIAFTHFHWDHIQGFPFFAPAYVEGQKINILALGVREKELDVKELFKLQMKEEYFPVQLEEMGADFRFLQPNIESEIFNVTKLIAQRHNHPGGAYGYRLERLGKKVVVCTDIEHEGGIDASVVEFCQDADLLVHEAQYTDEELEQHRGWGHSSYRQAIEVAKQARVKKLILTHHDPDHDDAFLREQEKWCKDRFEDVQLAREEMEIIV